MDVISPSLDEVISRLPVHMQASVRGYVARGQPPGSFLSAVLENHFFQAICRADIFNLGSLRDWASLLAELPRDAWGSPEVVRAWVARGGQSSGPFDSKPSGV